MDRALQLEMDSHDRPIWGKATPLLDGVEESIAVEFIEPLVLKEWREWVQEYGEREFTWERLHFLARRQYPEGDSRAQELVEEFLSSLTNGLNTLHEVVSEHRVAQFRKRAKSEFKRIKEKIQNMDPLRWWGDDYDVRFYLVSKIKKINHKKILDIGG